MSKSGLACLVSIMIREKILQKRKAGEEDSILPGSAVLFREESCPLSLCFTQTCHPDFPKSWGRRPS